MWGIQLTVTDPRLKNSTCLRLSHKNMNNEKQWKSSGKKKKKFRSAVVIGIWIILGYMTQ